MANQNIWPDSPGPSDNIGVPRIKEERIKDERIKREAINKSGSKTKNLKNYLIKKLFNAFEYESKYILTK